MPDQILPMPKDNLVNPIMPPHKAEIFATTVPHIHFAVAVTDKLGLQVHPMESENRESNPHRAMGTRTVADLVSLTGELDRRPLPEGTGTVWGNVNRGQLTVIYNDHYGFDGAAGVAGWRDDKLELKLATDRDWAAWQTLSGKFHSQTEFGDHIEELLHTIIEPDQADMVEIIESIRSSTNGEFESSTDRSSGSQKLAYRQEHTLRAGRTGELEIPKTITLDLRPWEGHPQTYTVSAWFRVKVNDGKLQLAVKLKPTTGILREAWRDLTDIVFEQTGRPVYAQP